MRINYVKDPITGEIYSSYNKLCSAYGIKAATYLRRIHAGWDPATALTKGLKVGKKCRDHRGVEYDSESDMCRAYNISLHLYYGRRRKGWPVEKALTEPNNHEVFFGGEKFDSVDSVMKSYGISRDQYKAIKKKKVSPEQEIALATTELNLSYGEKQLVDYVKECISSEFFHNKSFCSIPDYTGKELLAEGIHALWRPDIYFKYKKFQIIIEFDGIQHFKRKYSKWSYSKTVSRDNIVNNYFFSREDCILFRIKYTQETMIKELLNKVLSNPMLYIHEINPVLSIEEYYRDRDELHDEEKLEQNCTNNILEVNGILYFSRNEACRNYDISHQTVHYRLQNGWNPEEAFSTPTIYRKKVIAHDGIEYKSQAQFCKKYGISQSTFSIKHKAGKSTKQIVEEMNAKIVTDHLGQVYKTKALMCKAYGLSTVTYNNRAKKGWSKKQILTTSPYR